MIMSEMQIIDFLKEIKSQNQKIIELLEKLLKVLE